MNKDHIIPLAENPSFSIQIKNISKKYGNVNALNDVSISIEDKKIYGLLGRNGAGKTTLLNILTNKIYPTSGEILINSENIWENQCIQSQICYMTEKNLYPREMKVLDIFKSAQITYDNFDMDMALNLASYFKLNIKKKNKSLSKGFESILKIIVCLASNAPVAIMDEPVLGLDAAVRDEFYKILLENYVQNPRTLIISTHLIEEISSLIEEAIILHKGRILVKKPVDKLLEEGYCATGKAENVDRYCEGRNVIHSETIGKFKNNTVLEPYEKRDMEYASQLDIEIMPISLQKLFIHMTGGKNNE